MILAIETSTPEGSVAIARGGEIVFNEQFHAGRSHSSQLFGALERALDLHPLAEVRQIVVGLGPGSYAGVRIAISAAIGLAVARVGVELFGMPSIVALGEGGLQAEYLALGDARRDSFYFARVKGGLCLDGPRLVEAEALQTDLEEMPELPRYASEVLPGVAGVEIRHPVASTLALYVARGIGITARGALEPIYLREPYITQPRKR